MEVFFSDSEQVDKAIKDEDPAQQIYLIPENAKQIED